MRPPRRPRRRAEEEGARRPEEGSRRPERPEAASSFSPSSPSEARTGEQAAVSGVASLGQRRAAGLAGADRRGEPNLAPESRDRGGQAVVAEIVEGGPSRGWRAAASKRESDPVDMTERRRERLAERRRVRKRRIVRASVAGAALVLLAWVVFFSPLLALRSGGVEVRGAGAGVADADVKAVVAEYVGTPLVRLNTGEVESKVRKSLPMVKRAKVTRNFPGGVTVALTLRKPVACMMEKTSCTAIDEDGVRLDLPKSQTASLPKLKLANGDAPRATSVMGAVLGALDEGTRRQVASVEVTRAGQVSFTLQDGATVNWGGAEESAVKARVLKGLLSQKAKFYDVSAPHAPVTEN